MIFAHAGKSQNPITTLTEDPTIRADVANGDVSGTGSKQD